LGYQDHSHFKIYFAFFVYSATLGAIFPRLGDLQIQMGIGEATLGLALMGVPLGAQIALIFGGKLVEKLGFRKIMLIGVPVLGLAEFAASTGTSPLWFFALLVLGGLGIGGMEIVVNLEADRAEYRIKRRIMNRAHAFWSFGFFVSAMIGAIVAQIDISPSVHLFSMFMITTIASIFVLRNYQPFPPRGTTSGSVSKFIMPTRGILMLVAFTLSAMLLEGAGIDWSVIFMRDTYNTVPFISGMALALGAFTQAVTRFFADGYVEKFGPVAIARASIVTMGFGVILVTFSIDPMTALLGFALLGIGNSVIFPLAMSAAAQRTDRPAATNVAALAQLSFITFLIAPALLGVIAEHIGIRYSFGIGIPLVILSWMTLHSLSPRKLPRKLL